MWGPTLLRSLTMAPFSVARSLSLSRRPGDGGDGGDAGDTPTEASPEVRENVAREVTVAVVQPAVAAMGRELRALDAGARIAALRRFVASELYPASCSDDADDDAEDGAKAIQRLSASARRALHAPTMALRAGLPVDENAVLASVRRSESGAIASAEEG